VPYKRARSELIGEEELLLDFGECYLQIFNIYAKIEALLSGFLNVKAGDIYCTLQAGIKVTIMAAKNMCPRQVSRRRSDKGWSSHLRILPTGRSSFTCSQLTAYGCFILATFPMGSREWCSRAHFL
jgi:hypothetical protein